MKCVIFTAKKSDEKKLVEAILKRTPDQEIETHGRLSSIVGSMGKESYRLKVAILLVNLNALNALVPHRDLLEDTPLIFILSGMDENTLTAAHKFYPRFVTTVDRGFADIAEVVHNMKQRINPTI